MPIIDMVFENIAPVIKLDKSVQTLFLKLDLRFTYSQIAFSLTGGNATEAYQFQTGFYGLTDMPAEF